MLGRIRVVLLMLCLGLSGFAVISIFNSPEGVNAGIDCTMGPGSCGCYIGLADCQTHWQYTTTCDNGTPGIEYAYVTDYHKYEHYDHGWRKGYWWGKAGVCIEPGTQPPQYYSWCDNTCG